MKYWHNLAPENSAYEQLENVVDPATGTNVPVFDSQNIVKAKFQKINELPGGARLHAVEPTTLEYFPAGHEVQESAFRYFPGGHVGLQIRLIPDPDTREPRQLQVVDPETD